MSRTLKHLSTAWLQWLLNGNASLFFSVFLFCMHLHWYGVSMVCTTDNARRGMLNWVVQRVSSPHRSLYWQRDLIQHLEVDTSCFSSKWTNAPGALACLGPTSGTAEKAYPGWNLRPEMCHLVFEMHTLQKAKTSSGTPTQMMQRPAWDWWHQWPLMLQTHSWLLILGIHEVPVCFCVRSFLSLSGQPEDQSQ